jgi:phosphoglycerate dehydrogenase-like enzyme
MNVGIIGAGHIAEKMATTLGRMDDMSCLVEKSFMANATEAALYASTRYCTPEHYMCGFRYRS